MDQVIPELISAGPVGLLAIGACWFGWKEYSRANMVMEKYTGMLIDQSEKHLQETLSREKDNLVTLQALVSAIKEGRTS